MTHCAPRAVAWPPPADGGDASPLVAEACRGAVRELHDRWFPDGSPHASHARGVLYYSAGLFEEAAEAFERAAAQQPRSRNFYLLGVSRMQSERCAGALSAFRRALALDPDLFMAYYQMAAIHRKRRRFRAALRVLEAALRRFQDTTYEGYVCNELGLAWELKGDLDEAARWIARAAGSPHGDRLAAQVNLAWLLYKRRRFVEARRLLEAAPVPEGAPAFSPPAPQTAFLACYTLGSLALQEGDAPRARELLSRAVELAPRSAPAWNSLAVASEAAGDLPGANRAVQRALALDPGLAVARHNLEYLDGQARAEAGA